MKLITFILNASCFIGDSKIRSDLKVKQNLELMNLWLPLR